MSVLSALPARPLREGELTSLNLADAVDLAVAVEGDGPTRAVVVATTGWVKGLGFDGDGWRVVETVRLDAGVERIDGLQTCEEALLAFHDVEDPDALEREAD